ncbi:class 1b ribonucleoside-diphosphate reductase subunit alpha [Paenibacillus sp. SC116]|uniref:class 1b ribonucleoside-diphosphate reductase subunit alpha n=1 Tax=Paenibacillus sp. SC116 TaxID=2968986 RepID=UPI0035C6F151
MANKTKHIELNNEVKQRGADGFYQLEKDREATKVFMREVIGKTIEFENALARLRFLVDETYYYDVFAEYTDEQLTQLHEICDSYNFRFQSYMAASKFYKDYALQTNDKRKYLENYAQHVAIAALNIGGGDYEFAEELARAMMEQRYQPATPTFMNAGRARRGEMVSCFLLETDDSLNSINYIDSTAKQLSKIGGGVAINLSKIRARGEAIKGVEGCAKGVFPVAKALENGFAYCDQLGARPGAGAVYLNIFHWDVLEFLDSKKINADEVARLQTISTGLIVPSKFFELAEAGEDFYMFAPHTVHREYGTHLDDMDISEMYYELVANPNVKKRKMNARSMLTLIAQTQLQSGYPYLFFKDNANDAHPLKALGDVKMSNLCTEIMQLQETSVIRDYGVGDEINRDISCNLGSLNIVNVMESGKLRESIHTGIEALTIVSDVTRIANAPGIRKANEELHSIGLGAMNLHGYLAKNGIAYELEEARDFVRTFFAAMNYYSLEKSMLIAKERGETFKGFEQSEYANGNYFAQYKTEDFSPRTDKVRKLFEESGIALPSQADWSELSAMVAKFGIYHAYRLAIAPTQSISYIQNSTASVMPIVDIIEHRSYDKLDTYYPMPFLSPQTQWFYKSAFSINQYRLIDLVAEAQRHIDQGISTILFVNSDVSTRELSRLYTYARKKGLKSLYYTRTNLIKPEECTSCAI